MSKGKRGGHERGFGGKRRGGIWTVLIGGQKGTTDNDGYVPTVRAQSWNFPSQARAERFASNIQGARVSGPKRFWTPGRVLFAAIVVAVLVMVFAT